MRTAYQYKLRPNSYQIATIELWLELLRRQYNYRFSERLSRWEENRKIKNRATGPRHPEISWLPMQWQGRETRSPHYSASLVWEYNKSYT
ncbi:helix-turn-helix domain-containing protein [Okeania sp. SIO2B3]|uniref:helix-turn-helix domain-containing protein n=1 Tax=Okeania sp. SIO2B3 TaxID=2607784 RepID=UPI0013C28D05|nr:helix-turn-helix domain-containing protein [Okeania sp. SIO2B3]NET43416.1 helix-turn-helix domain-containing protein [Okeania sp. SIO2B3]